MRADGGPEAAAASPKERAERVAIVGAAALAALKFAVGLTTNSLALISAAVDSLLDVAISTFNLLSLRLADTPPDAGHPYGHGKAENLAGLVQTLVIGLAGGWLCVEALRRLFRGTRPEHAEWAIAAMILSTLASWLIARHLERVGRESDSLVLLADAAHYRTDVWTNAGVLAGLALLLATGSPRFDPLIALVVAGFILRAAYRLLVQSVRDLMDAALPETEQHEIERVIRRHAFILSSARLRTRRSGSQRHIDFTVTACRHLPLGEAHALVDHVEKEIEATIPNAHVVVHAEPCPPDCAVAANCVLAARRPDLLAHE